MFVIDSADIFSSIVFDQLCNVQCNVSEIAQGVDSGSSSDGFSVMKEFDSEVRVVNGFDLGFEMGYLTLGNRRNALYKKYHIFNACLKIV